MVRVVNCRAGVRGSNPGGPKIFSHLELLQCISFILKTSNFNTLLLNVGMQNKKRTPPSYSDSPYLTLSLPALNKENNFYHGIALGEEWVGRNRI